MKEQYFSGIILFSQILNLILDCGILVLIFLVIRALWKYLREKTVHGEDAGVQGSFGEKIKNKRIELNLSQEYVAERLGVSRQAVSRWEKDSAKPSTANLIEIAALFGMSVDELVGKK